MNINFSTLTEDQIMEMSNNKSYEDILNIEFLLRESIRHYLSRLLMDTDKENPLQDIIVSTPEDVGISELEKPLIKKVYQDPSEGTIYFLFEGIEEYYNLDCYSLDLQILLLKAIKDNYETNNN